MTIETTRCLIRYFEEKDLDAFMAYRNNTDWMRYQGFKGLSKADYRKALLGVPDLDEGVQLAVTDKSTSRLIGDLYLRREADTVWIGYTVCPSRARQGYAFEAVGGMLDWIRQTDAKKVFASALPENTASIRLLEKLGFDCVGTDEGGDVLYQRVLVESL